MTTLLVSRARLVAATVLALVVVVGAWSSPVAAHTEFVSSTPTDGATVEGPLSVVVVEFTNPAVESGDGFELLSPDGTIRSPSAVDPTDGTVFRVSFDPPLESGTYGFRWQVQAGDAHPIDGSFQFTVEADATTTTSTTTATAPPGTETSTPPSTVEAAGDSESTLGDDGGVVGLDEFLADDATGDAVGRAARTLVIAATVFAVGVTAALVWVVRGRRDELERLLAWVRLAGLCLAAGGLMAFAALDEVVPTPLGETATSKPGVAALMAMLGGVLVFAGFSARAGRFTAAPRSLSAATVTDDLRTAPPTAAATRADASPAVGSWSPDRSAAIGLAGLALAVGAYWFDGHTVSRGPWAVHAAVNLVHVASASVWVGGVFAMALVAMLRRRERGDTGLAEMVVRFSTIAGISLAALAVAGVVMAWLVLDEPGDLFSTDWGRVLLVKVGAVTIAAGLGAYNHFALRPALAARPADPDLARHLRVSLLVESAIMAAVVVLTAVLVAAST